ncbi:MAG TPA: DNRLRE domain-containing protein [Candidatus Polarisedimenticolaceae bacterium]|nr:DNRLRE domain-containing protein [Candidatus Polarisedimenticolaceae bacterium]
MIPHKALFAATLFAVGIPVFAAEVTIAPSRDTSLFQYDGTYGCGDGPLFAGQTGAFGIRRALVRFDVAAAVPAGSTIQSVSLEFYVAQSGPLATITDLGTLHRILSNWGEGASVCFLGDGVPAETGDATWTYSFYNSSFWATAGGDFAALASASTAMPVDGSGKFDSTAAMVADVQGWLDTPATNDGWILRVNEVPARSARKILSREEQDEVNSGPMLNIVFAPPVNTPPAVPDGQTGTPFRIGKVGSDLQLTWDTASCTGAADHHVLYGTRNGFPAALGGSYALQGSVCDLGTSSPYTWTGSPDPAVLDPVRRLMFILVVADDNGATEGSWGHASQSFERNGVGANGASNQCGILTKDLGNTCGNGP